MKSIVIKNLARTAYITLVLVIFISGCADQAFQVKSGESLSPESMRHLVLRAKYPDSVVNEIPAMIRHSYEAGFRSINKPNVRVVAKEADPKPEGPYYYLDTAVTKYKPGSAIARAFIPPVLGFGLWGSYVNVDYRISDPSSGVSLGNGIIRKANLWGGLIGLSITSETQLLSCPEDILDELDSAMEK